MRPMPLNWVGGAVHAGMHLNDNLQDPCMCHCEYALGSHGGHVAVQVAKSLQDPMAAEANGSEAAPMVRPRKSDISNGLECKLSTSTSKVSSFNDTVHCPYNLVAN